MKNIHSRVSKMEKVVEENSRPEGVRGFLAKLGLPENEDLLLLGLEEIIIRILARAGEIPKASEEGFWQKLKTYCEGGTVRILDGRMQQLVLQGKLKLDDVTYRESKPSKPLNFHVIVRGLGLKREEA